MHPSESAQNGLQALSDIVDNFVSDFSKGLNEVAHVVKILNDQQGLLNHRVSNQASMAQPLGAYADLESEMQCLSQ